MKRILQNIIFLFVVLMISDCTKTINNQTTIQPTVDTFLTGKILFTEPPVTYTNNGVTITVNRSCPCNPSNEIYFFSANAPAITDSANTVYTWTIRMAATIVLTGKKAQYRFPIKGSWKVELDILTNGNNIHHDTFTVYPNGQRANNRQVGIQADCIDANRKYFVSLFSTHLAPLDGHVNAIYWDFGDGSMPLTDTNYLQHKFPIIQQDSTYYVKLFINNSNGCKDSAILPVFVPATYVDDTGAYLFIKKFTWTQSNACNPNSEEFTFVADTAGMPANAIYEWDFKDYVTGIRGTTVKHKFTFPNRYDVNLRVWHNGRMISEWYDTTVRAKGQFVTPIAYFYSSVEEVKTDSVRRFFNCQSKFDNGGFLTDIEWTFGDGTAPIHRPQYDYNARHTYLRYANDSTYDIRMIITANSGCKDTSYTKLTIPAK